ncbi:MAG: hypothetical protein V1875_02430 [Candidatus Altiarchaeota archaeon]
MIDVKERGSLVYEDKPKKHNILRVLLQTNFIFEPFEPYFKVYSTGIHCIKPDKFYAWKDFDKIEILRSVFLSNGGMRPYDLKLTRESSQVAYMRTNLITKDLDEFNTIIKTHAGENIKIEKKITI